jgi:hypothetical protein
MFSGLSLEKELAPRCRSESIVTKLWADDRDSNFGMGTNFPQHHCFQTESGPIHHPDSNVTGTVSSIPGVKRLEREASHSRVETENEFNYTSTAADILM